MKTNFKKCAALTVILGIGAFAVTVSSVSAQGNCDWYGLQSAKQQQENLLKKCGFAGDEWSKNVREHRAWCNGVGPDVWQSMMDKRQKALDGCK